MRLRLLYALPPYDEMSSKSPKITQSQPLHHISAHIPCHAVDFAGELAQRRILGHDGHIGNGTTGQATGNPPKNQSSRRRVQKLYPTGYNFGYGFCARL